ncbi:cysteine proteinase [Saitoella complicata NRRL Y-17804]|nr:cysteine proteinase [Saitoella complicata NRRL Y-17804]ODQ53174.1 cysteine proteinase [Saitoella complicata NRRL Y-17804]
MQNTPYSTTTGIETGEHDPLILPDPKPELSPLSGKVPWYNTAPPFPRRRRRRARESPLAPPPPAEPIPGVKPPTAETAPIQPCHSRRSSYAKSETSRRTSIPAAIPALPKDTRKPTTPAKPASPTSTKPTEPSETPTPATTTPSSPAVAPTPPPKPKAWGAPKAWSELLKSPGGSLPSSTKVKAQSIPAKAANLGEALQQFQPQQKGTQAPKIQPRGLINTGNMCFMNAILQVLIYCPAFYNLLDSVGKQVAHRFASNTPLMDAMIIFLREFRVLDEIANATGQAGIQLKQEELEKFGEVLVPEYVYGAMRGNPRFDSMRRGHQEDAEEFLGFLLDGLHEEFISAMKSIPTTIERYVDDDDITHEAYVPFADGLGQEMRVEKVESEDGWLEVGKKQKTSVTRTQTVVETPITRIFGGKLRSVLKVPGQKASVTLEPYQPLQLDIQPSNIRSILDAMKHITEPESLDWINARGENLTATKQVFIETLPPVLILHLKRFIYDMTGGTQKSWKKVGYPLEFEVPPEVMSPGLRTEKTRYMLFGVVYHHGQSAQGGHYTVDVRTQEGTWLHVDDTNIVEVRPEDVAVNVNKAEEDGMNGFNRPERMAYILFFMRV